MSKESVNRALAPAALALLPLVLALPAGAQVALIVGSVRDQHGAAVPGAVVAATDGAGKRLQAITAADGTFALEGSAIASVSIECRFCARTSVAVKAGEPVVAVIRRYDALLEPSPSQSDLANLPYAHVESAVALRPFTLLSQSTGIYPGSVLSDRGLSSSGSLLIDNGAPNYDISGGNSPYTPIPAGYEQAADFEDASGAFLYGNLAGGGVVQLHPFSAGDDAQTALIGGDAIVRAQVGSQNSALAAGSYSNDDESRQRADGMLNLALPADQSLEIAAGTEQGREYSSPTSALAGSFTFADAVFDDPRAANLTLQAVTDRGNYGITYGSLPFASVWSDTGFSAGAHTSGAVQAFADVATRLSTGSYDAQTAGIPLVGATLVQNRADAGVRADLPDLDVTGGVGLFWLTYGGGAYGDAPLGNVHFATPSLSATLFPDSRWSVALDGSGSFVLPTFFSQYAYANPYNTSVGYDRSSLFSGALTYTDLSRVSVTFESATQSVRGSAFGTVTSEGIATQWQIAPAISLRAWTMHVTDTSASPYYGGAAPGAMPPTAGAFWLTYQNGDGVRADAIYRRDLLDGGAFYHFDGDLSGPIARALRWYAGAEDRLRTRYLDLGVRFNP